MIFLRFDAEVDRNLAFKQASDLIVRKFEKVNHDIQTAQKSQRGYLLTKDEEFLDGYKESVSVLPDQLFELLTLVRSDSIPSEVSYVADGEFRDLYNLWVDLYDHLSRTIELKFDQADFKALTVVRSGKGEKLANEIDQTVSRLNARLNPANDLALERLKEITSYLDLMFWIFVGLLATIGVVIVVLHHRRVELPLTEITNWLSRNSEDRSETLPKVPLSDPQLRAVREALASFQAALRKANEEKLEILEKQLRDQFEFSSVLAHEVRTPLATMHGLLALWRSEGLFDKNDNGYNQLERSAASLLEVVNSALDYQAIRDGTYETTAQPIEVPNFLNTLLDNEKKSP